MYRQTRTRHVFHHHIEIVDVLEGIVKFHDPLRVGVGHDISLLPKEGRVRPSDHLKLGEQLHRKYTIRLLHAYLQQQTERKIALRSPDT
jgi:hypothetical protein